ncbi:hypothetical protein PIB30_019875 [Stylosanthes scabra]|uniref:Uncharacterized protein n=2 Tax=Stylosanthes scabra TaxID=79078 RepID=A0ABU6T854_9FABA|nr:hypothetical protein [Stylosanthes scabra]
MSVSNNGIRKEKRKICNGPENSTGNVSEQSVSANIVECSNSEKTVEGEHEDNTASLKSSQSVVATMHNGVNVVLVAAPVSQVGKQNSDQSNRSPCNVYSGKSMVGSPVPTSEIRTGQSSGDCEEEQIRHTRKYRKRTSTCPVRRSPRLIQKGNGMGK